MKKSAFTKIWRRRLLLLLLTYVLICGNVVMASDYYDYTATTECLQHPWNVQYGGGIIDNPEFSNGLQGWMPLGQSKVEERSSPAGSVNNKFIAAYDRKLPSDGIAQKVYLEKGRLYALSAWVQISGVVSDSGISVIALCRGPNGERLHAGSILAENGCWSLLKGGIVATTDISGPVYLQFETEAVGVEIWLDNVSLQPFTDNQWRSHQDKCITKVRKSKFKLQLNPTKKSLNTTTTTSSVLPTGAKLVIKQNKPCFPIGCEINYNILTNAAYQNWFTTRFTVTAFGNEMKWYSNEKVQGQENYTVSDAMMKFAEEHNIAVRGHNIFWANPNQQPTWVPDLSEEQLQQAVEQRMNSVVTRYKGRLIHWDVENENVHFRFFQDKLGEDISGHLYARSHELDPKPVLFMNEYNTIEMRMDQGVAPDKYAKKLKSILGYPGNENLSAGIGLQTRFGPGQPNLPYMRAGLDYLGSLEYPIWLTELFVDAGENQAGYLEQVMREGYGHPSVEGIVIWPTSPFGSECKMCLTDQELKNTPNGDVVDKLINEWKTETLEVTAGDDGVGEVELFHGDYEVRVVYPGMKKSSSVFSLKVGREETDNVVLFEGLVSE